MELLTGECKKKFEKWRDLKYEELIINNKTEWSYYGYSVFRELSFSMQYGILVDFFDSVGVNIDVLKVSRCVEYRYSIEIELSHTFDMDCKTRPQARKQAIQKANELFNNK